jgi:hypothetical protein
MSSKLLESVGLGGIDIAYFFIGLIVFIFILFILLIVQMNKLSKLKKRYEKFMLGSDAKSMEEEIHNLFEDIKVLKESSSEFEKEIANLYKKQKHNYQKLGIVNYDAFQQMGGKLSFCLVLLDENDNGFVINSVHSSEGCYSYTKKIKHGECKISLGEEEQKALDIAMGNDTIE